MYFTTIRKLNEFEKSNIERLVSPQRLKRSELFTDEENLNRFLYAEIITAKLIKETFSIPYPYFYGEAGKKPLIIDQPDISFSRTYSDNNLVIFMEDKPQTGVDCQSVKSFDLNILKYFFTEKEQDYIKNSVNVNIASNILWTRKESFIKFNEKGLEFPIKSLDITPFEDYHINGENSPLFYKNDKISDSFINSYLHNDTAISVCSCTDDVFPKITDI